MDADGGSHKHCIFPVMQNVLSLCGTGELNNWLLDIDIFHIPVLLFYTAGSSSIWIAGTRSEWIHHLSLDLDTPSFKKRIPLKYENEYQIGRNICPRIPLFFNQEPKLETSAKACKEEDDHNY